LIYKAHFPENHIDIAWTLDILGNVYRDSKNYQQAKDLFGQSLVIYERHYGRNHVETARVLKDLGLVYLEEDQLETAENLLTEALDVFQQNKHPEVYLFLETLAELFLKKLLFEKNKGNTQQSQDFKRQAIDYLKQALTAITDHFPKNSPHITRVQNKINAIDNEKIYSKPFNEIQSNGSPLIPITVY
jgi:tetratricopeptide (TPR) repeat protein